MISLDQYFTELDTGDDRRIKYKDEFKDEYTDNASNLLEKVNSLLKDLNIDNIKISSGWRPASINGKITNAAKKSYHMICQAVDIVDNKSQDLAKLVASKPELLKKYNLWLEDPQATRGHNTNWCHLDIGNRSDRPSRMFKV